MLVLSRKVNERIVIDGRIVIKVAQIVGNNIRLGVDAPEDVIVDREEVFLKKNPGAMIPVYEDKRGIKR